MDPERGANMGKGRVQERRGEDVGEGGCRRGEGAGDGRVWESGRGEGAGEGRVRETEGCGCGRGEGVGEGEGRVCASSRKEPFAIMFVAIKINDFVPENINCISFLVASPLSFY